MDYAPDLWHDFAVTVGGLAGALTGLLFVALSIKSEVLDRSLRSRAAQTLVLFVTSALIAVVLVAPQPAPAIGVELLGVAAVTGTALFVLDRRAGHDPESGVARYIEAASPNMITAVLTGVAGLLLLVKAGGGLYWLIPAVLASPVRIDRQGITAPAGADGSASRLMAWTDMRRIAIDARTRIVIRATDRGGDFRIGLDGIPNGFFAGHVIERAAAGAGVPVEYRQEKRLPPRGLAGVTAG